MHCKAFHEEIFRGWDGWHGEEKGGGITAGGISSAFIQQPLKYPKCSASPEVPRVESFVQNGFCRIM